MTFVEGLRWTICIRWISIALAYPYLKMGGYFHGSYDSIWVIMDCLTKSAHFLLVDTRYSVKKYAKLYLDRIVTLHGVPLIIVSDRVSVFVSRF